MTSPSNAFAGALLLMVAHISLPALAFDLQGHRGARGLAPENTLRAFERALAIGVDTLELDIGVTADGVVVISHNPYLNPAITRDAAGQWLSGSKGPLLKSLTLAQLQAHDVGRIHPESAYAQTFNLQQPHDGARIPTLGSLFDRVRALGINDLRFNIETKINPGLPDDTLSPEAMTRALLKVIPWTINNPADMERLIGWGVDGVITDYPDRLRTVMQARGLPLPKPVAKP